MEIFDKLDIPAARYNSIDDLLTDPHLTDVGFFEPEDHPSEGKIRRTRPANTFSGGDRAKLTHAPTLGEHTSEVLAEAGYTSAEIEADEGGWRRTLMHAGAVRPPRPTLMGLSTDQHARLSCARG